MIPKLIETLGNNMKLQSNNNQKGILEVTTQDEIRFLLSDNLPDFR
jgi:hypothetical protein